MNNDFIFFVLPTRSHPQFHKYIFNQLQMNMRQGVLVSPSSACPSSGTAKVQDTGECRFSLLGPPLFFGHLSAYSFLHLSLAHVFIGDFFFNPQEFGQRVSHG